MSVRFVLYASFNERVVYDGYRVWCKAVRSSHYLVDSARIAWHCVYKWNQIGFTRDLTARNTPNTTATHTDGFHGGKTSI